MKMKKLALMLVFACALGLNGCGGGGGGSETPTTGGDPIIDTGDSSDSSKTVASAYTGTWNGTYDLTSKPAGTPVTFKLTGVDSTNAVTGKVYSQYIAGDATGTKASDGTVTLSVANIIDSATWSMKLANSSTSGLSVVSVTSPTSGAASVGSGSCTASSASGINLAGLYTVTFKQTSPTGSGETYPAQMILAKVSDSSYVGAIVGAGGLQAKITLFKTVGYWWLQIPSGEVVGTNIIATKGLLSQESPILDSTMVAAVNDGVVTNIIAPLSFKMTGTYPYIYSSNTYDLSTTYDFNVYLEGTP